MFTGIVEEIGTVQKISHGKNSAELTICADTVLEGTQIGDSIAVNGICLTVTALLPKMFTADVMHETLQRSSLAGLTCKSPVNLERAMSANGRFGGHMVSGHVDGTGKILHIRRDGIAIWYTIQAKQEILRYIVEKGSVAVDGISLTVAKVGTSDFSISAIPHTIEKTILKEKKEGSLVNLETDIVGKYVEKLLGKNTEITRDFLEKYGF